MSQPQLFRVDRLDLAFTPKPWPFAHEKRAEIDAFFAEMQRDNPAIWNGRVLLLYHQVVSEGVFKGDYLETDYASFIAWRRWGSPPAGVRDCFSAAAILSADGAVLLGEMGPHTANAGKIYFPCGTPDPNDIVSGKVDLARSVERELKEETGFDIGAFTVEPGWTTVVEGPLIVQVRTLRSVQPAAALRAQMLAHLASEAQPELSDIRIVRGPQDYAPTMPMFVRTVLDEIFTNS
jgi:8-oxo-dGTP pyrophosphatase MutT (NUDIX family)